jgi:hypothetical protein
LLAGVGMGGYMMEEQVAIVFVLGVVDDFFLVVFFLFVFAPDFC